MGLRDVVQLGIVLTAVVLGVQVVLGLVLWLSVINPLRKVKRQVHKIRRELSDDVDATVGRQMTGVHEHIDAAADGMHEHLERLAGEQGDDDGSAAHARGGAASSNPYGMALPGGGPAHPPVRVAAGAHGRPSDPTPRPLGR